MVFAPLAGRFLAPNESVALSVGYLAAKADEMASRIAGGDHSFETQRDLIDALGNASAKAELLRPGGPALLRRRQAA